MDIRRDTLNLPIPPRDAMADWDEAYGKVENYLRACRVRSRMHRARLTAMIMQRAIQHNNANPTPQPLSMQAIDEARNMITEWLSCLLPPRADGRPYTQAEGFLAIYLSDLPTRWPDAFLDPREVPAGFLENLNAQLVKTGPELELSSMVPRPIDRGLLSDLAGSAMDTFDRLPILRTLFVWFLFTAALIALFWYTR